LFPDVLKKFFTGRFENENNIATTEEERKMLTELKTVLAKSSDTLIEDALGVLALFGLLFVGLSLPAVL
jgi:hypothetical protein